MLPKENLINIPSPLLPTAEKIYELLGFQIVNFQTEAESREYCASTFEINGLKVKHRQAKITPTKTGQFVTLWKRDEKGITAPFDAADEFDLVIISVQNGGQQGQFIFPKTTLVQHKIITHNGIEGKRGIRVYPPWDTVTSKQAEKTQQWQTQYFLAFSKQPTIDTELAKKLFNR